MVQGVVIDKDDNCIIDINPATGEIIDRIKCTSTDEIDVILKKARKAFSEQWRDESLDNRIQLLKQGCCKLKEKSDELSKLITMEMGKPINESIEEVDEAVNMESFLDMIHEANKDVTLNNNEEDETTSQSIIIRDPLGVVVVLSPWNFPAGEIMLLVLPALAAGNTVVVKPSEVTPKVGQLVINTLASVLPEGVLQITIGDGSVGKQLVDHDLTDMIAMTGSTNVGKDIMSKCAKNLKRLVLELGGKDPMIVFNDANLDLAASDAVSNSLFNTGQVCCSVERIYVDDKVKDEFESKVVQIAKEWKVGNGMNEENKVGPMVSKMQRDIVASQVDDAIKSGAKVLYQSDIPSSESQYYPVTVLSDVKQNMMIQNKETFGPVISISTFDGTEQEGIKLANDTEYGLASYVYTSDINKASRVARRIESGQVGINCYSLNHANPQCPWVGHKMSGFGYHSGMDGFRQFSVPKSLVYKQVPAPPKIE